MAEPIQVYLHDHLAGSNFATELLKSLRDQDAHPELATFAVTLLAEVEKDAGILRGVLDQIGKSPLDVKEALAWVAEKASRLKLQHQKPESLGTFEAFKALSLGIMGNRRCGMFLRLSLDWIQEFPGSTSRNSQRALKTSLFGLRNIG